VRGVPSSLATPRRTHLQTTLTLSCIFVNGWVGGCFTLARVGTDPQEKWTRLSDAKFSVKKFIKKFDICISANRLSPNLLTVHGASFRIMTPELQSSRAPEEHVPDCIQTNSE